MKRAGYCMCDKSPKDENLLDLYLLLKTLARTLQIYTLFQNGRNYILYLLSPC